MSAYQPTNKRSQVVRKGGNTIILDAYNANPDSMQAAIHNLSAMRADHKAVMLGDMYELGEDTAAEHRMIGELLAQQDIQTILFCGPLMEDAHRACPNSWHFQHKEALVTYLQQHPMAGSTILIKGSRGMAMETLVDAL